MTSRIPKLDKKYLWHPFTQMQEWCAPENHPLEIKKAKGIYLYDANGKKYIDGNSSIWTNIHGHCHPRIVRAIQKQAKKLDHSSFLGLTHKKAVQLAARLVKLCNKITPQKTKLKKVFYSDDGSTAIEVAQKMSLQYHMHTNNKQRTKFIAFSNAYHGDTAGAASLGGVPLFFDKFKKIPHSGYKTIICSSFDDLQKIPKGEKEKISAVVIEPMVQGVAGIKVWQKELLGQLRQWCDDNGILLIFDEVLTGFGRTGKMFACEHFGVSPDFLCLAKGLSGGTLPIAVTLTTKKVFYAFLGKISKKNTFYYGHSYTANPIACSAALSSIAIFKKERTLKKLKKKILLLKKLSKNLQKSPAVAEVRQCGLMLGIDLKVSPNATFSDKFYAGKYFCNRLQARGFLTRPILNTIIFMPPLCISKKQLRTSIKIIESCLKLNCYKKRSKIILTSKKIAPMLRPNTKKQEAMS